MTAVVVFSVWILEKRVIIVQSKYTLQQVNASICLAYSFGFSLAKTFNFLRYHVVSKGEVGQL